MLAFRLKAPLCHCIGGCQLLVREKFSVALGFGSALLSVTVTGSNRVGARRQHGSNLLQDSDFRTSDLLHGTLHISGQDFVFDILHV